MKQREELKLPDAELREQQASADDATVRDLIAKPLAEIPQRGWPPRLESAAASITMAHERHERDTRASDRRLHALARLSLRSEGHVSARTAFLGIQELTIAEADKWAECKRRSRVVFYDYVGCRELSVWIEGDSVQEVVREERSQHPLSPYEQRIAVELARAAPEIASKVEKLQGQAIMVGSPGRESHRCAHVTFNEDDESEAEQRALYTAVVDLNQWSVIEARPAACSEKRDAQ